MVDMRPHNHDACSYTELLKNEAKKGLLSYCYFTKMYLEKCIKALYMILIELLGSALLYNVILQDSSSKPKLGFLCSNQRTF